MWELRWVVLQAPRGPLPPDIQPGSASALLHRATQALRPFAGRVSDEGRAELLQALGDGWEPFETTALKDGDVLLWLRRQAAAGPQVVEVGDLPGQYL